jgi:hypothetical protein
VAELGQSLELAEADAKSLADELEHQRQMVGSSTDSAQAEQVRRLDVVHQQIEVARARDTPPAPHTAPPSHARSPRTPLLP